MNLQCIFPVYNIGGPLHQIFPTDQFAVKRFFEWIIKVVFQVKQTVCSVNKSVRVIMEIQGIASPPDSWNLCRTGIINSHFPVSVKTGLLVGKAILPTVFHDHRRPYFIGTDQSCTIIPEQQENPLFFQKNFTISSGSAGQIAGQLFP